MLWEGLGITKSSNPFACYPLPQTMKLMHQSPPPFPHRHAQTHVSSHLMPQIHNFACPTSINSHLKTLHVSGINELQQHSKAPYSPKVVEEVTRKVPLVLWSS